MGIVKYTVKIHQIVGIVKYTVKIHQIVGMVKIQGYQKGGDCKHYLKVFKYGDPKFKGSLP